MTFGPSSVFSKKDTKRESLSRTASSSNMFSMLSQGGEPAADPGALAKSGHGSRKGSVDLAVAPEAPPQRKRLVLQPRSKPTAEEAAPTAPASESGSEEDAAVTSTMSEEEAKRKVTEDSKEFFGVRNLDEAEGYFSLLPTEHHFRLVEKLVSTAIEAKETSAQLVADFFARAASKELCSIASFEEGFMSTAEALDDIAIDAPKAVQFMVMMMKGAGLDKDVERRERIASKSTDSDDLLKLLA